MKKTFYHFFAVVALLMFGLTSCEKNNFAVDQDPLNPGAAAKFNVNTSSAKDSVDFYFVSSSNNTFKLPIGVTNVANVDRTVSLTVDYGSAVEGVQVNSIPTSLVIPAGEAEDSLVISGLFSGYSDPDRLDTIIITINENSDFKKFFNKTRYKVIVRQFCDEADVVLNNLLGLYDNTIEQLDAGAPYGPYTTEVTTVTSTGPTTAHIGIANIWDTGWGPMTFELDWTDPANRVVRVVEGAVPGSDAGDLAGSLAGQPVYVKPHPTAGEGTFSYCSQSFDLTIQLGYGAGTMFPNVYKVKVRR